MKRARSKEANRVHLLVFVEGERTEVGYLTHWHRKFRQRVLVEIDERHGTPMTLVHAAIAAKKTELREERRGRGKAHDEYWCLFDRDEHPHFDEALKLAADNGVSVAVSNPCLELWFIWHFEARSAYIERDEVQRLAEAILGCGKHLTPAALERLDQEGRFAAATKRALAMDLKHEGDGSPCGSNPSSTVHRLIEAIRGPEIDER